MINIYFVFTSKPMKQLHKGYKCDTLQSAKKNMTVGKENDFVTPKNNRNVTRNLCISIFMIFTCCLISYVSGSVIGIDSSFRFTGFCHSYW